MTEKLMDVECLRLDYLVLKERQIRTLAWAQCINERRNASIQRLAAEVS